MANTLRAAVLAALVVLGGCGPYTEAPPPRASPPAGLPQLPTGTVVVQPQE